jgi:hypothetical protein
MTMRLGPTRSRVAVAAVVVALVAVVGACSERPAQSPAPMSVRLFTELAACNSLGGCAAYVSLSSTDGPNAPETRLSRLGPRQLTQGLPGSVPPGSYRVHFRSVLVSDEMLNGHRVGEYTDAECSLDIATPGEAVLGSGVDILVVFRPGSCDASATYSVAMS